VSLLARYPNIDSEPNIDSTFMTGRYRFEEGAGNNKLKNSGRLWLKVVGSTVAVREQSAEQYTEYPPWR